MKCDKCGEKKNIADIFTAWFCMSCGNIMDEDEEDG